jgi:hypothetical protein
MGWPETKLVLPAGNGWNGAMVVRKSSPGSTKHASNRATPSSSKPRRRRWGQEREQD